MLCQDESVVVSNLGAARCHRHAYQNDIPERNQCQRGMPTGNKCVKDGRLRPSSRRLNVGKVGHKHVKSCLLAADCQSNQKILGFINTVLRFLLLLCKDDDMQTLCFLSD